MTQQSTIGLEWIPTQYRSETFLAIVRSVEVANHAGADRWGLRLDEHSLMLKVGPHEVLQVVKRERSKSGLPWHVIVDRERIPASLRSREGDGLRFSKDTNCYGARRVRSYYPSHPGTEACDFEFSVLQETYHALHDAHVAVIRRAVGLPLNPATRQKHSSALVALLASEIGHRLAQPAWMTMHEKQVRI